MNNKNCFVIVDEEVVNIQDIRTWHLKHLTSQVLLFKSTPDGYVPYDTINAESLKECLYELNW